MKKYFILTLFIALALIISTQIFTKNAISQNQEVLMSTEAGATIEDSKLIVYYFYTTARCASCLKIEQYTKESLEKFFSDEIASGKVDFQMLKIDEPQNKHYIQDYQLYTKSVVLSKIVEGKEEKFKNLDKVWQLLRNKEKFYVYIKDETLKFLN